MPNIKEEIKQKKFNSVHEEAGVNLIYTSAWVDSKMKDTLKPYNVSQQQFNVLRILRGALPEKVTAGYIKERMIDKESNITRLIDKLVIKNFVTRDLCPSNRRKMDISITKQGLDELLKMDKEVEESNKIFSKISNKEAKELSRILDKLRS